ncbi:hypothetical protein K470DRAFT_268339 [Piedraia hortae CBS 480.64]|uniref:Uncharacterized protein n=1 Tax=Piedraia hortae CBS 480.64 TaxID=1314780 RepID=A0A6A7C6L0_9PEZI|nr:hypothetical protein K470DRAFT_268339 [Piedraia hortae CBS 480.64]
MSTDQTFCTAFTRGSLRLAGQPKSFMSAVMSLRRPQCTHTSMRRLHGNYVCEECDKPSSLGWVYVCDSDYVFPTSLSDVKRASLPHPPNGKTVEDKVRLAKSLGLSASVVNGIKNGDYTSQQVDQLIQQKAHVLNTLKEATSPDASIINKKSAGKCHASVCDRCRRTFHERIYTSFEWLLGARDPAVTEEEISNALPMRDPEVFRNLGKARPDRRRSASPHDISPLTSSTASIATLDTDILTPVDPYTDSLGLSRTSGNLVRSKSVYAGLGGSDPEGKDDKDSICCGKVAVTEESVEHGLPDMVQVAQS